MGSDISKQLSIDPSFQQSEKDVHIHHKVFGFSEGWNLGNINDAIRKYMDNVDPKHRLQSLHDLIKNTDKQIETLVQLKEQKAQEHDINDGENVVGDLEDNREPEKELFEIEEQLQAVTQRKQLLISTFDTLNDGYRQPMLWEPYYHAMQAVNGIRDFTSEYRDFSARHPVCINYAMKHDPDAAKQLQEYRKGPIKKPPIQAHEIDGHTDDDASESSQSDIESLDGEQEDVENDQTDVEEKAEKDKAEDSNLEDGEKEAEKDDAVTSRDDDQDGKDHQGSSDTNEGKDEESNAQDDEDKLDGDSIKENEVGNQDHPASDNPQDAEAVSHEDSDDKKAGEKTDEVSEEKESKSSEAKLDGDKESPEENLKKEDQQSEVLDAPDNQIEQPRFEKRTLPESFNPFIRTPIFFGYSTDELDDPLLRQAAVDNQAQEKEKAIFLRKATEHEKEMLELKSQEEGRLKALLTKQGQFETKRKKAISRRQTELDTALKELIGTSEAGKKEFEENWAKNIHEQEQNETLEKGRLEKQVKQVEQRIKNLTESIQEYHKKALEFMEMRTPIAKRRIQFHKAEIKCHQKKIVEAKSELETARLELEATVKRLRLRRKEASSRAQILFCEGQVREKNRTVEKMIDKVKDEEFLLERAYDQKEKEKAYLPLFELLSEDGNIEQPSEGFSLMHLLFVFVFNCKDQSFEQKSKVLFEALCCDIAVENQKPDDAPVTVDHLFPRDLERFIRLSFDTMEKVGNLHPSREITDEEIESLVNRAFSKDENITTPLNASAVMSYYDFRYWCQEQLNHSQYLAMVLNVPWKFHYLGRYQRQWMSDSHQYKLGMISLADLHYRLSQHHIQYKPELAPFHMETLHSYALSMGQHDPFKTDYTKYLPSRHSKLHSFVVPLEHGCYMNYIFYRTTLAHHAATLWQTYWRGKTGREKARLKMKVHAFYHKKGVELQNAKDEVLREWKFKANLPRGVAKMKFDAKVRLKQVQYRASGHVVSTEEVISLMIDEAVQSAQLQTELRFNELERDLGYDKSYGRDENGEPDISTALLEQIKQAKARDPRIVELSDLVAKEAPKEKKKDENDSNQDSKEESEGALEEGLNNPADETKDEEEEEAEQSIREQLEIKRQQHLDLSKKRKEEMVSGSFPPELYTTGETIDESIFKEELSLPSEPSLALFKARIKKLAYSLTELKTKELMLEIPNKRILCRYVDQFSSNHRFPVNIESIEEDLEKHFRIARFSSQISQAFMNIHASDLEFGLLQGIVKNWHDQLDVELNRYGQEKHQLDSKSAVEFQTKSRKTVKGMKKGNAGESDENLAMMKQQRTLVEAQKTAHEAHSKWRLAQLAMNETRRRYTSFEPRPISVDSIDRLDWCKRLEKVLRIADEEGIFVPKTVAQLIDEEDDTGEKYQCFFQELDNLITDFTTVAQDVAKRVISEYYLPFQEQSIPIVARQELDGQRTEGDKIERSYQHRYVYEMCNIHVKVGLDDHGMYDGSDEAAAKAMANSVRGSKAYLSCKVFRQNRLRLPLQALVTYYGISALCSAKLPLDHVQFSEQGNVRKVHQEHVFGTIDRGRHVACHNQQLVEYLNSASEQLNIALHNVRGSQDLTSRAIPAASDIYGYVGKEETDLYLMHFKRAMPPEDPHLVPHLFGSTREQSIFWRLLRPEFVKCFEQPLSPDAFGMITRDCADWEEQAQGCTAATKKLLEDVVPEAALYLVQEVSKVLGHDHEFKMEASGSDGDEDKIEIKAREAPTNLYLHPVSIDVTSVDVSFLLHQRGINLRHLGLVRNHLVFQVTGSCTLMFSHRRILTTHDFTQQVFRGMTLLIQNQHYKISSAPEDTFDSASITLDRSHQGPSVQSIPVYAGNIGYECLECSFALRTLLLVEMVIRTFKQLARLSLRHTLKLTKMGLYQRHLVILIELFNIMTGSPANSTDAYKFWHVHVYHGIRTRYGMHSVSSIDRQGLRRLFRGPWLVHLVRRVSLKLGVRWNHDAFQRFIQKPNYFRFSPDDIDQVMPYVKHNAKDLLHMAEGFLLSHKAAVTQKSTYSNVILHDQPIGYWPLDERRGSAIAKNRGSAGRDLQGSYRGDHVLEFSSPLKNDSLRRALDLQKEAKAHIAFKTTAKHCPTDIEQHMTMEVWGRVTGAENTLRIAISFGRFTLAVLKSNVWAFITNVMQLDVVASAAGSAIEGKAQSQLAEWQHVVGTYDGTNVKLYVNGELQGHVEAVSTILNQLQKQEENLAQLHADIDDAEKEAKAALWRRTEKDCLEFFRTKDGEQIVNSLAKRFLDEEAFKMRLQAAEKKAASKTKEEQSQKKKKKKEKKENKQMTKKAAISLAKKQHTKEQFDRQVLELEEQFTAQRMKLHEKLKREEEERKDVDSRPLRIGCISSKRHYGGQYFYVGQLAHIAYYKQALTTDTIVKHYHAGSIDRAYESDRFYSQSTERFLHATKDAPGNRMILQQYASTICRSLRYDFDFEHSHELNLYKRKCEHFIQKFRELNLPDALVQVIRSLPHNPIFADLFVRTYTSILELNPEYFTPVSFMTLEELGKQPPYFSLGRLADDPDAQLEVHHANIIRKVVNFYPNFYGDGYTDLKFLKDVHTPSVVVNFVIRLEDGFDPKNIDLQEVSDVTDADMDVITASNRGCTTLNISGCQNLSDTSYAYIGTRCTQLLNFHASNSPALKDECLHVIAKTEWKAIEQLYLARCVLITDFGLEHVVETCRTLIQIDVQSCNQLTDDSIIAIGRYCPFLAHLNVAYCFQITDYGLIGFSSFSSGKHVRYLNFLACHRLHDPGICAVVRKCTLLEYLNIGFCQRITDVGLTAITHNGLELTELNCHQVDLITDQCFFFDRENDGRPIVEKKLLQKIRKLTLTDCKLLTANGISSICHRARSLEALNVSGCPLLNDHALKYMTEDAFNTQKIGDSILFLDLSFCTLFTDDGLGFIVERCLKLRSMRLNGNTMITEAGITNLIQNCNNIQDLALGHCRIHAITDQCLRQMSQYLWLEHLNLTKAIDITDEGIEALAREFTGLVNLNISWCKLLTDRSLDYLEAGCPHLKTLHVERCPNITLQRIEQYKESSELPCPIEIFHSCLENTK